MTYSYEDDRKNPEPWKTNYVRESYAREKHPDHDDIIQLRREDFDNWLERKVRAAAVKALRDMAARVREEWNPNVCPWVGALDDEATRLEQS